MSEEVKIGLIGAGRIARVHADAYSRVSGGRIVAAADPVPEARNAFAKDYNVTAYEDYKEMLAQADIDAVVIAAPNGLHAPMTLEAAAAGKHIFCQKPMALTLPDTDAMMQAVEKAGIVFQLGFMLRFTPPMPRVKEIVDSGALGDIIAFRAAIFGWEPTNEWFYMKDQGGGVILDTMIHFADLAAWLVGPADRVFTEGGAYVLDGAKKHESPDNASVMIRHKNGASSQMYVSWTSGYGNFTYELYGTKGSIAVNFMEKQGSLLFLKDDIKTDAVTFPSGWSYPDMVWPFGYAGEAQYFVDQIRGIADPGEATGIDGKRSLELVLAAQQSLDEDRIIKLEV